MKLKVVVLSGGPSAEHEVSLKTGKMIAKTLDRTKYNVEEMMVGKDGTWPTPPEKLQADVVFVAMHGEYGEDGTVQKILGDAGLTYTGSGVGASRLGMDKVLSAEIFKKNGLLVPEFEILKKSGKNYHSPLLHGVVVKPSNRGSSVGVTIVEKPEQLQPAIKKAKQFSDSIMIQKFIAGREVTCGVLDDGRGNAMALPPTEIIPHPENKNNSRGRIRMPFFDYKAKYTHGASQEITPPNLPPKIIKAIQETALKAHKIIGCSGMSRTDMIIEISNLQPPTSNLYVLEINTIPGMTETSLLPQEAKAAGISFPELLDRVIQSALNKK